MIKILQFSFLIMARKDANFSIARIIISGQLDGNKFHMRWKFRFPSQSQISQPPMITLERGFVATSGLRYRRSTGRYNDTSKHDDGTLREQLQSWTIVNGVEREKHARSRFINHYFNCRIFLLNLWYTLLIVERFLRWGITRNRNLTHVFLAEHTGHVWPATPY